MKYLLTGATGFLGTHLARALEAHDSAQLDEVARLIGRLAVTIE